MEACLGIKKLTIIFLLLIGLEISFLNASLPIFPKSDKYLHFNGASDKYLDADRKAKLPATLNILGIMVQFQSDETSATTGSGLFGSVSQPSSYSEYPMGRSFLYVMLTYLQQYYTAATYGKLNINLQDSLFNTTPIVTLDTTMSYYGDDQNWAVRELELFRDAIYAVDDYVNFAKFDEVVIFHAGCGQEADLNGDSPDDIWSVAIYKDLLGEYLNMPNGIPTNDYDSFGNIIYVSSGIIVPESEQQDGLTEFSNFGTICHEFGHLLGLPDLYNTMSGNSSGIGSFGLMGAGEYNGRGTCPALFSAWSKEFLGLLPVLTISFVNENSDFFVGIGDSVVVDLPQAESDNSILLKVEINKDEYFLLENRERDRNFNGKFDFDDKDGDGALDFGIDSYKNAEFDFTLPGIVMAHNSVEGSGILIWHIDKKIMDNLGTLNVNAAEIFVNRKGVDLEEADGVQDLDSYPLSLEPGLGSKDDAYRKTGTVYVASESITINGNNKFSFNTIPNSNSNSDACTFIDMTILSQPDSVMSIKIKNSNDVKMDTLSVFYDNTNIISTYNKTFYFADSNAVIFDMNGNVILIPLLARAVSNAVIINDTAFFVNDNNFLCSISFNDNLMNEIIEVPLVSNSDIKIIALKNEGNYFLLIQDNNQFIVAKNLFSSELSLSLFSNDIISASNFLFSINDSLVCSAENSGKICVFNILNNENQNYDLEDSLFQGISIKDITNNKFAFVSDNGLVISELPNFFNAKLIYQSNNILSSSLFAFDYNNDNILDIAFITLDGRFHIISLEGVELLNFVLNTHNIDLWDIANLKWQGINFIPLMAKGEANELYLILSNKENKLDIYELQSAKYIGLNFDSDFNIFFNNSKLFAITNNVIYDYSAYLSNVNVLYSNYGNSTYCDFRFTVTDSIVNPFKNEFFPEKECYFYPNPCKNANINLRFAISMDCEIKVELYDLKGEMIKNYSDFFQRGRDNEFKLNISNITSGIYFAKIIAKSFDKQEYYWKKIGILK